MSNEKTPIILLVDDEPDCLYLLESIFLDQNYITIKASDGREALKCLKEVPNISCIVLDRMMPNLTGLELLAILKKDPKTQHIPVIIQSALAGAAEVEKSQKLGAYAYLTKPFKFEECVELVQRALADHSQSPSKEKKS